MPAKLVLRESSFNGIPNAKKQVRSSKATGTQMRLLEDANKEIKTHRRKEAMAYETARAYSGI